MSQLMTFDEPVRHTQTKGKNDVVLNANSSAVLKEACGVGLDDGSEYRVEVPKRIPELKTWGEETAKSYLSNVGLKRMFTRKSNNKSCSYFQHS